MKAFLDPIFIACLLSTGSAASAATVWNGPPVTFSKAASADPNLPENQDRLTDKVWLTRGMLLGWYNAKTESSFAHFSSPADTEWATGKLSDFATLKYTNWNTWAKIINPGPPSTVGLDVVVHLISEDIYLSMKITSWAQAIGDYSYTRSSPGGAVTPPMPPLVKLTAPSDGLVLAAPADLSLAAEASASNGSVTNVSFFQGTTLLGVAQAAPFNFRASNLGPGSYAFSAVATAGGISSTSDVVRVSIITPSPLELKQASFSAGGFSFNHTADRGLRYVVERATAITSPNTFNWIPITTNTAGSDTIQVSEPAAATSARFYRVRRLADP